jgi:hypothetical protein
MMETEVKTLLLQNPRQLLNIFWQSPISMEYYNSQGRWECGNPASLKTFGVTFEDVLGFDLFTDPNIPSPLRKALQKGRSVRFSSSFDFSTVTYKTDRTGVAVFEFIMTVLRDDGGKISGYLVQTIDKM